MRRPSHNGFTLIEMVIVVAIISIVVGIAIWTISRSKERVTVDRVTSEARSKIERARALAAVAGSRDNARIAYANCTTAGPSYLWTTIDQAAGTMNVPGEVTFDSTTDQLTVTCEDWSITQALRNETYANATFDPATFNGAFAFTPTGRVLPVGTEVFVKLLSDGGADQTANGFRILSSGVMCQSNGNAPKCDESVW